jgi:hypothetical protein
MQKTLLETMGSRYKTSPAGKRFMRGKRNIEHRDAVIRQRDNTGIYFDIY